MKSLAAITVLILSLLAAQAQTSNDSEVLTNESIVKLVQSGLGVKLIIKMIDEQQTNFHLGTTNVIQLKQKGVPQSVISAMLSKETPGAAAPNSSTPTAVNGSQHARPVTPNYVWSKVEKTDPITQKQTFALLLDTPAVSEDGGVREGTFEVTATCNSADTSLQVVFLSDATPGIGFKQNTETYLVQGGLFGALAMASHHQKPWTVTRVRVGELEGKQVTSENDYKNAADIYFTTPQPNTPAANQDEAGTRALLQFASFLGPNKPAGETEDLFRAKTVLLEMEFENGVKSLLTLRPQDASFQDFADRCRKQQPERINLVSTESSAEIRPPDRTGTEVGNSRGDVRSTRPPIAPTAPLRFAVPAGAQLTMTVQEALDLNGVRAYQMVHASLTKPMQTEVPATGAPGTTNVMLGVGTDVYLRCTAAAGMGDRLNVRLELDHAVVHGTTIPLQSAVQTRQTSRGLSLPSRAINVRGLGNVRLPQSRTPPNPVVIPAKEQLSFSTSQLTYAPSGFKP